MSAPAPVRPGMEPTADEARILANWVKRPKVSDAEAWNRLERLENISGRRFNSDKPPAPIKPRWLLAGKSIATPGNICIPQSQAGTGKSNFIGAFITARIVAEQNLTDCDCLGIQADGTAKGVIVWIDTEQSDTDFFENIKRCLRRAGVEKEPEWLHAYRLAGHSAIELRTMVLDLLWSSELDGVYGVIIDGIADLVADVNDAEECNAFVARLHKLAIEYDCPIIGVLHENPGSENGKGRGHLGSQLERKAESVLRLQKTDDVTVVYSKKARRAPIMEKDGPRFRWCNEAGMHVSCETIASTKDNAKRDRLRDQAEAVFSATSSVALSWSDMRKAIAKSEGIGISGAGKRFDAMCAKGVVQKDAMGLWRLSA